jgi:cholesterol transport system auxiliary component
MIRLTVPGLLAAAALALALAGCGGSLLNSDQPAPETYRLGQVQRTAPAAQAGTPVALPVAIVVARPRASSALDTDRVATYDGSDRRFDFYAGVRWAEPAPRMLQQQLVDALADGQRFGGGVFAAPARVPAELLLDVELRRFEAVTAGSGSTPVVHVQVQASLVDSRKAVRVTSFLSEAQAPAAENRRAAVIGAFDVATAQVVADVAARIEEAAATVR